MEEELTEDVPEMSSGAEEAFRTSSTALEVEEELIVPASTSIEEEEEEEEDTVEPKSTTSQGGEEDLKDTSLLSSEWETSEPGGPQEQSLSKLSSLPLEGSEDLSSSTPSSQRTSPLPWKGHQDGPQSSPEGAEVTEKKEQGTDRTDENPSSQVQKSQAEAKKAKKKAGPKKGAPNYTVRPVVPAEKAELLSVAKAMHRENFGKNVKELFHLEKEAALRSIETGLYIGWRCPEYLWDCFRVGDESKCFCGHLLKQHQVYVDRRATVPCALPECRCQGFTFIPSHPEEVGEFWLRRRTSFDPAAWRAKCRCKHSHEEHAPTGARTCTARGCPCMVFTSNFLCAACDRRWEEHETFFESEDTRRKGEAYLPFAEMPGLRNAVLTGCSEDNSAYQALLAEGLPVPSGSRALPLPPSGPRSILEKDDKKA